MNIYIAENIRRLRRERGITQEKLADSLGVTTQAVSKWERGEAFPDITLVLPIAGYFGITADVLLSHDETKTEERIQRYFNECYELTDEAERLELLKAVIGEFPDDLRVIELYALNLPSFTALIPDKERKETFVQLCTRILNEGTQEASRNRITLALARHYAEEGDYEKAEELVRRFPDPAAYNRDEILPQLYPYGSDEYFKYERINLQKMTIAFTTKIMSLVKAGSEAPRDKIRYFRKAADILSAIYEDGDIGNNVVYLSHLNFAIAACFAELDDFAAAAEYFAKGFELAKVHDTLPETVRCTSYLLRGIENVTFDRFFVRMRLDDQTVRYKGTAFAETPEYKAIMAEYAKFVNNAD
ncbi:MAG: helix-turn-helix domain-containing protein [Oscillospiraceae bacterium]|jgi:transcriptional regulator with XRE-family HTH domain|nr:helix-turn-helix domain-containing protein [Oscillospiraceae bacterium]